MLVVGWSTPRGYLLTVNQITSVRSFCRSYAAGSGSIAVDHPGNGPVNLEDRHDLLPESLWERQIGDIVSWDLESCPTAEAFSISVKLVSKATDDLLTPRLRISLTITKVGGVSMQLTSAMLMAEYNVQYGHPFLRQSTVCLYGVN